jgi:hypothetical protein
LDAHGKLSEDDNHSLSSNSSRDVRQVSHHSPSSRDSGDNEIDGHFSSLFSSTSSSADCRAKEEGTESFGSSFMAMINDDSEKEVGLENDSIHSSEFDLSNEEIT